MPAAYIALSCACARREGGRDDTLVALPGARSVMQYHYRTKGGDDHDREQGTLMATGRRTPSRRWLAVLMLAAMPGVVPAQGTYPAKAIRIIAPVQPGGGVDLVARTIGERLQKALGQPVVIENQSGGGG